MNIKILLSTIIVAFFVYLTILLHIGLNAAAFYHESAHQRIFKEFGCDSEIVITSNQALTIPADGCFYNESMSYLHSLNEIFGYHIYALTINLWLMLIAFITILAIMFFCYYDL